jgi:hypothetical protein
MDEQENRREPSLKPFWDFMDCFLDEVEDNPELQAFIEEDNKRMLREAGFEDDEKE